MTACANTLVPGLSVTESAQTGGHSTAQWVVLGLAIGCFAALLVCLMAFIFTWSNRPKMIEGLDGDWEVIGGRQTVLLNQCPGSLIDDMGLEPENNT